MRIVRVTAAWVLVLWMGAGCGSPKPGPCPPLKPYTQAENEKLAEELESLPDEAVTIDIIADYMALRDQLRACQ